MQLLGYKGAHLTRVLTVWFPKCCAQIRLCLLEVGRRQLDVLSSRCLVSRCVWVRRTKETHCEETSEYKAVPRPHGKCHSVISTGTERNFTLSLLSHFLKSLIFLTTYFPTLTRLTRQIYASFCAPPPQGHTHLSLPSPCPSSHLWNCLPEMKCEFGPVSPIKGILENSQCDEGHGLQI